MNFYIIGILFFFLVLVSIQYTLNQILYNLKEINRKLDRTPKK